MKTVSIWDWFPLTESFDKHPWNRYNLFSLTSPKQTRELELGCFVISLSYQIITVISKQLDILTQMFGQSDNQIVQPDYTDF